MAWKTSPSGLALPDGAMGLAKQDFLILPPSNKKDCKVVAAKAQAANGGWYGVKLIMDQNQDITERGVDTMSIVDQLALQLMRHLEDVDGRFRFQQGDEAQGVMVIWQWPLSEDSQARWDQFVRFKPDRYRDNQ